MERAEKKQILIVEDEPAIAENIAFAVGTENMEPICVGTAREADSVLVARHVELEKVSVYEFVRYGLDVLCIF